MDQPESTAANPVRRSRKANRRRWLQFSIRTLLVLVTLLCVALGVWVVPAERQRRAIVAIEALGGSVTFVNSKTTIEPFPKTLLRRWLPQSYVDEVKSVAFYNNIKVTDAELVHLQGLTSLRRLWLYNSQVTDAGLAHLQGLTSLQRLVLGNTQVTDARLADLQGLTSLKVLWLNNTKVTDAGLAHLKGLTGLRLLDLDATQVTDAGLVHLKGLTGLQGLSIQNTQITDAGLAELHKALPNCIILGP